MHLSFTKSSKKFLPLVLSSAIAAALAGCNGGSDSDTAQTNPSPVPQASKIEVPVDSTFTAILMGRLDHNLADTQATDGHDPERTPATGELFEATLTAINTITGEEQSFAWPIIVDIDDMQSQKTISIEPGTYNFALSVEKGSQQYVGVLTEFAINDTDEIRLSIELEPSIGDTIVDILSSPSQLTLNYPASELAGIDVPQVGVIIDGVEHIFAINTATGVSDVLLNIPEGAHEYEIKLYNGDIQIGRSEVGPQTLDLVQGDTLNIDLISLQADVTVDITGSDSKITFNVPQEMIDRVSGSGNLNVHAKLLDSDGDFYERVLTVQELDGRYFAEYILDFIPTDTVTADLDFLDIRSGTGETFASCENVITIGSTNTMKCGIISEHSFDGNLLATLAINVLDSSQVAQAGAKVYVDGELKGITGSSFGTDGFVKVFVKAGEEHLIRAEKDGLEDSLTKTPLALSINNLDLILEDPIPDVAKSCLEVLQNNPSAATGTYTLDPDADGPLDSFTTFCDMDTEIDGKKGGWTLVQNRINDQEMTTTYSLAEPVRFPKDYYTISLNEQGAIANSSWLALRDMSTELMLYAGLGGPNGRHYYTTFDKLTEVPEENKCISWEEGSSNILNSTLFHIRDTSCAEGSYAAEASFLGHPKKYQPARTYAAGNSAWIISSNTSASDADAGTAIFVR